MNLASLVRMKEVLGSHFTVINWLRTPCTSHQERIWLCCQTPLSQAHTNKTSHHHSLGEAYKRWAWCKLLKICTWVLVQKILLQLELEVRAQTDPRLWWTPLTWISTWIQSLQQATSTSARLEPLSRIALFLTIRTLPSIPWEIIWQSNHLG